MSIFLVNSNLNHDNEVHEKGSFFDGELSVFQSLVDAGVLSVVDGASSIEDAKEIVEKNIEKASEPEVKQPESQNTWGPKPDEPVVTPVEENQVQDTAKDQVEKQDEQLTTAPASELTGNEL